MSCINFTTTPESIWTNWSACMNSVSSYQQMKLMSRISVLIFRKNVLTKITKFIRLCVISYYTIGDIGDRKSRKCYYFDIEISVYWTKNIGISVKEDVKYRNIGKINIGSKKDNYRNIRDSFSIQWHTCSHQKYSHGQRHDNINQKKVVECKVKNLKQTVRQSTVASAHIQMIKACSQVTAQIKYMSPCTKYRWLM